MNVPTSVLDAYDLDATSLAQVTIGLVNRTWLACTTRGERVVLQRLHPVFAGEVNEDIDAITRHLASRGLVTPRLVRTTSGEAFVAAEGVYRVITYIEGMTRSVIESPAVARTAASLVAEVHSALEGFDHTFAFTRPGAHDTRKHLAHLAAVSSASKDDESRVIADAILAHAADLPALPRTRPRIVHGDLKITNVLFTPDGTRALALVDLDTFAFGTIPIEMGDAFRSWCNPKGESDTEAAADLSIFEGAVSGYLSSITLDAPECEALVLGFETISTELAARFCVDAFEDRYFGYDATRYESRVAHNRVRARSQLGLARSVRGMKRALEDIVAGLVSVP